MPKEKSPLGPVGRNVVHNVRELREARGMTYKELSDRLAALGRPIPVLGLSRLEKGERRVDADDLTALAIALRVNPSALLLPRSPRDSIKTDEVELTPAMRQRFWVVWRWADGRLPLPEQMIEATAEQVSTPHDESVDFATYARPAYTQMQLHPALMAVYNLGTKVEFMIAEHGEANLDRRIASISRELRRVIVEIESLIEEYDPEGTALNIAFTTLKAEDS